MDPVDQLVSDEWAGLQLSRPRRLLLLNAPHLLDHALAAADQVRVR